MNHVLTTLMFGLEFVGAHPFISAAGLCLTAVGLRALFPRRFCGTCGGGSAVQKTDWLATIVFKGMVVAAKQAADYDGLAGHSGTEKKLVCGACGVDWNPNPTGAIGCLHVGVLHGGLAIGCLGGVGLISERW